MFSNIVFALSCIKQFLSKGNIILTRKNFHKACHKNFDTLQELKCIKEYESMYLLHIYSDDKIDIEITQTVVKIRLPKCIKKI